MTNTAHAPGRPFKLRLITSPMRDIVRFRATGRLELMIYPDRAGLPSALADLVVRITKQTRLRALEKADVARELSAHFAEGIAVGKTTDELIDSFGDIRKAVKLIRRAKKRNRSRVLRAARRAMVGAFSVLAILYASVLIWYMFGIGKVNPSHDYLADMNAVAAAVPEQERAWPVYRKVFLQMGPIPRDVYLTTGPADYRWPQAIEYIEAHQSELEQFRRIATMPGLGYVIGLRYAKADLPLFDPEGTESDTSQDDESASQIPMIEFLLPQLGYLRKAAFLLKLDALHQLESGTTTNIIPDIRAIIGIARQVGEQDSFISQLVRISMQSSAVQTTGRLLTRAGESLTDEDLAALDKLFNPAIVGDLCSINTKDARRTLLDIEQHIYTDNGRGNGRLHSGTQLMNIMGDSLIDDSDKEDLIIGDAPLLIAAPLSILMPDRKSFRAQGKQIYDAVDGEIEKPLWERDDRALQPLFRGLESSYWEGARWSVLLTIVPALSRVISMGETTSMQRDAIRTAIALFRYRLVEHSWPTELNALVPVYLDTLPIDRFTGKPLRYKLDKAGQFILYSVGSDLDDDHGVSPLDDDGWPEPYGANRWFSPSRVAKYKSANPSDRKRMRFHFADGDFVLYPPLPDKPVEPDLDPYADLP